MRAQPLNSARRTRAIASPDRDFASLRLRRMNRLHRVRSNAPVRLSGSARMRLIEGAIRNPIAVAVTVVLVCPFGTLSLKQLPLQLFPDVERPTLSINTTWRGASPEEVEAELLEPQEQVLQGLAGVEEIQGSANAGGSQILLTFAIGTDMKAALVEVIGRMSRLPPLPRDADRPIVQIGGVIEHRPLAPRSPRGLEFGHPGRGRGGRRSGSGRDCSRCAEALGAGWRRQPERRAACGQCGRETRIRG